MRSPLVSSFSARPPPLCSDPLRTPAFGLPLSLLLLVRRRLAHRRLFYTVPHPCYMNPSSHPNFPNIWERSERTSATSSLESSAPLLDRPSLPTLDRDPSPAATCDEGLDMWWCSSTAAEMRRLRSARRTAQLCRGVREGCAGGRVFCFGARWRFESTDSLLVVLCCGRACSRSPDASRCVCRLSRALCFRSDRFVSPDSVGCVCVWWWPLRRLAPLALLPSTAL